MRHRHTKASGWATVGLAVAGVAVGLLAGCSSEGLSPRESGQQSYNMVMYKAAGQQRPAVVSGPAVAAPMSPSYDGPVVVAVTSERVATPAKIAVAQLGEVAPPAAMMDALRAHPELFRRVLSVPGTFDSPVNNGSDRPAFAAPPAADAGQADVLVHMRSIAGSVGADYLLVFGGQIDHGHQDSGLELLNLTIVGAFIVPSQPIVVDGKAAGSLIDVRSGQIVMNFSAQAKGSGAAPSAFVGNVEEGAVLKNKDELVQKLTADVVAQMTDEMKSNADR